MPAAGKAALSTGTIFVTFVGELAPRPRLVDTEERREARPEESQCGKDLRESVRLSVEVGDARRSVTAHCCRLRLDCEGLRAEAGRMARRAGERALS